MKKVIKNSSLVVLGIFIGSFLSYKFERKATDKYIDKLRNMSPEEKIRYYNNIRDRQLKEE